MLALAKLPMCPSRAVAPIVGAFAQVAEPRTADVNRGRIRHASMSEPPARGREADGAARSENGDETLIRRLATGTDEAALSELYDRYQATMYGLAMRITNDAGLAQDAVQEAFVGIWRNAARYEESKAAVRTWILSITHHRAIDLVRRRRPTSPLPETEVATPALTAPDVWPEVARAADAVEVRSAMGTLPDEQRRVIEMAYFEGLTQVEIADRTGAPLGTVKSRARLGLSQLRRALEPTR
jgi:RNA polymerase sigma-70 factor, ECF subfamily